MANRGDERLLISKKFKGSVELTQKEVIDIIAGNYNPFDIEYIYTGNESTPFEYSVYRVVEDTSNFCYYLNVVDGNYGAQVATKIYRKNLGKEESIL